MTKSVEAQPEIEKQARDRGNEIEGEHAGHAGKVDQRNERDLSREGERNIEP